MALRITNSTTSGQLKLPRRLHNLVQSSSCRGEAMSRERQEDLYGHLTCTKSYCSPAILEAERSMELAEPCSQTQEFDAMMVDAT